ncbi:MAG: translation initiation factor IF-2 subunit beta [Candidatus Micrarchaeota archaeon]|nr:translation initiation factor IF-2 subunit beta [Candidatus Micrarchaeota archaeon]
MDEEEYLKLLEEAYKKLPQTKGSAERFEMPQIEIAYDGNKTIWKNFQKFAEVFRRDPEFMLRYFKRELGAPIVLDGPRAIIHKKLLPQFIQKKLESFFRLYVVCWECGKVDTHIINVGGHKELVCEACGATRVIR